MRRRQKRPPRKAAARLQFDEDEMLALAARIVLKEAAKKGAIAAALRADKQLMKLARTYAKDPSKNGEPNG